MIQRIQTIWLLLVTICGIVLITGDIMAFSSDSGVGYTFGFKGLEEFSGENSKIIKISPGLQIALIVNILTAIVAIFLFRKHRIQKILTLISALLSISVQILLIYIAYKTISDFEVFLKSWIKAGLPLVMTASSFFAWKGIARDEKLVKSYDRLR